MYLTRNQAYVRTYRGFESLPLLQDPFQLDPESPAQSLPRGFFIGRCLHDQPAPSNAFPLQPGAERGIGRGLSYCSLEGEEMAMAEQVPHRRKPVHRELHGFARPLMDGRWAACGDHRPFDSKGEATAFGLQYAAEWSRDNPII
jgi:hypothetical protein